MIGKVFYSLATWLGLHVAAKKCRPTPFSP